MELASSTRIPDGLMAAMSQLDGNSRLGLRTSEYTLHPGFTATQSSTALRDSWTVASETYRMSLSCGFGGPSFHGSLHPRPAGTGNPQWDGNFGESLGISTKIRMGSWGIAQALGLPDAECEFGACGSGPSAFGPGSIGAHYPAIPPQVTDFMFMFSWAMQQTNAVHAHPWHYGNWCGKGGSGLPVDKTDFACMRHDYCYAKNGLTYADNFNPFIGETKGAAMQRCNEALCSATANSSGSAREINSFFSWGGGGLFDCHQ